jgi:micrococcal nuclease
VSTRRALTLLLVAAAALLAGRQLGSQSAGTGTGQGAAAGSGLEGTVVRVVDGDTIRVRLADGVIERVRYIGVDTPESVKPNTPVQCFAKRASAFNEHLVAGQRVRLVPDAEARDRYGRMLAYVYRTSDGLFVNAALVRHGYAHTLTIPPNVAHAGEFRRLASAAHRAGRGLWSACRSS